MQSSDRKRESFENLMQFTHKNFYEHMHQTTLTLYATRIWFDDAVCFGTLNCLFWISSTAVLQIRSECMYYFQLKDINMKQTRSTSWNSKEKWSTSNELKYSDKQICLLQETVRTHFIFLLIILIEQASPSISLFLHWGYSILYCGSLTDLKNANINDALLRITHWSWRYKWSNIELIIMENMFFVNPQSTNNTTQTFNLVPFVVL